jgi:cell division protein FtsI (penicillin-binding protein 3)
MNKYENKKIILENFENEFSYKKNKSNLNIEFNRIAFIFFIFFSISLIYSIQLIHLGSRQENNKKEPFTHPEKNYRADIIDVNGTYLVKTVSTTDVGINPLEIIDKKHLLVMLRYIFPNKNFDMVEKNIDKKKFFYLQKNIKPSEYNKVMLLGDKSIKINKRLTRIYPQENLFSHIIGQIDDDNQGISGIEKFFDYELKKIKEPLKLTVDTNIQFLIREELLKFKTIFRSKGAAAILMNVNNGEIISMVSLPDFNLNKRQSITDVNYINKVTKGLYELGSVFKTFTIASGFNAGLIEPDTKFLDSKKIIYCDKNRPIREYDNDIPADLTVEEILIRSGNIGSVRIAKKIGAKKHKSFLKKIGILNQIEFDIEEVGRPRPVNWKEGCKLETISFGHGIATTILQLAKGYSIITNGGYDIKPTLIKKKISKERDRIRILNEDVSKKINPILRKIVSTKNGTAKLANVQGYDVGGKTGTAEQPIDKKYSRIKINTFASIFPTENPKYVLVVMLESTKNNKEYIYEYRDGSGFKLKGSPRNTAGWTSVEAAGKILDKIGPILATKYIEN